MRARGFASLRAGQALVPERVYGTDFKDRNEPEAIRTDKTQPLTKAKAKEAGQGMGRGTEGFTESGPTD